MKETRARDRRRKLLVQFTRLIEGINDWAGPLFRLEGWHKSVAANAAEFDEVTGELEQKWGGSMSMGPEATLLFMLSQSAYMHHVQAIAAEMFVRQNLPTPEEMARANPQLMQTMMQIMKAKAAHAQAAQMAVPAGDAPAVRGRGRGAAVSGAADPIHPDMVDDDDDGGGAAADDSPPGDDEIERLSLRAKALPKGTLYRRTERTGANVPSYTDMRMPPVTRRQPPGPGGVSAATAGGGDDDDDDVSFG